MVCRYYEVFLLCTIEKKDDSYIQEESQLSNQRISTDLQLNRGTVLDRQMNMSYWAANRNHLVDANFNNVEALRGEVSVERGSASFMIVSPSHRIVGRFLIKLYFFLYIIKVFNLICVCVCVCYGFTYI